MINACRIYMIPYMRFRTRHPKWFKESSQYKYARNMVNLMKRTGRIYTRAYGQENLPEDGGYIMYPNHQGKYDALGIIYAHDKPCCIVMDEKRSRMPLVSQFIDLVGGKRMDINNARQSVKLFREIADELVQQSKKFIIFPEGGYDNNKNKVFDFKPGAFKAAVMAKAPVVPVALVDSYKVFEGFSLRKVTTQVHFLKPLYYDEYKEMSTKEIADRVKSMIEEKIAEVLSSGAEPANI
jgi:1-acyl-sn-glycerol-3-phosphate acyltransferase